MAEVTKIIFSHPTIGDSTLTASPAATFVFFSRGYQPPRQGRASEQDIVINQNGTFIYNYDNGPRPYKWSPFELIFDDHFYKKFSGAMATQQWANFQAIWNHFGPKNFAGPEGVYSVLFPSQEIERRFVQFPRSVGDKIEFVVTLQIEEG